MTVAIRQARPGEEEDVLAMYDWLFAPPGSKPWQWEPDRARSRLSEAIASAGSTVLVAHDGGTLIAFCTAYVELDSVRFGRRCWVEDLAVDPARRSEGIGASLLAAARDWARGRGATHLELDSGEARVDAHRFYEREGPSWRSNCYAWRL
jgi:GNAT superfamily N-acetyltransferase